MSRTVFVYVIGREEGPVKVGISANPNGRRFELQAGSFFPLQVLHAQPARNRSHALQHEQNFHEVCADRRLQGEWFDLEAYLAIEVVETGFEIEQYFEARA